MKVTQKLSDRIAAFDELPFGQKLGCRPGTRPTSPKEKSRTSFGPAQ